MQLLAKAACDKNQSWSWALAPYRQPGIVPPAALQGDWEWEGTRHPEVLGKFPVCRATPILAHNQP